MAYLARLALFGVCPYATLCALAVFFGWLPMSNPGAWATFTVVYLAILAVLILVFNARLSRKTRELNGGACRVSQEQGVGMRQWLRFIACQ